MEPREASSSEEASGSARPLLKLNSSKLRSREQGIKPRWGCLFVARPMSSTIAVFFSGAACMICKIFPIVRAAPLKNTMKKEGRGFYKQATPTGFEETRLFQLYLKSCAEQYARTRNDICLWNPSSENFMFAARVMRDSEKNQTPAALGFSMPAEWEKHEATWLGWPHHATDWPGKLDTIRWVYG